ncbi:DUF4244 domain-containing protein [Streptomyces sp. NPDC004610]|uniref:DUF4244 domain-containing protein n=1 Tax=unclassified Streptomyces TaxID=2593676 RepID=UPI0033BD1632
MYGLVRARVRVWAGWVRARARVVRRARGDAGMVTSEYALGLVAAAGFAVVLYRVLTSGTVGAKLQSMVESALDAGM